MAIDISVVMGVYNGALHLHESIESILMQEGVDLEFIIVNDGSTDQSGRILNDCANQDSRVKIICQENKGLTQALIRGCAEAKGKYIARQDVGDISLSDRLRLQKAALDTDEDISFVSCWTEYYGPEWEFLYLAQGTGAATIPVRIISEKAKFGVVDGPVHHGSVMFRRNSYISAGEYRPQFYFGQDWDLWYRLSEHGKFQMIAHQLYRAKVMPGSISGSYKKKQDDIAKFSLAALQRRLQGKSEEEILKQASSICPDNGNKGSAWADAAWLYFIGECLRRNGNDRAFSYLKRSVMTNPFYARSWVRLMQILITARQM